VLELYHYGDSVCSLKVRLCLAEKGLEWTGRFVDLLRFEQLRPEYLRLNPNGVVPTLVHDGRAVIESTIINEYLDEVFPDVSLRPADAYERARMRAWVKFEDDVLHPAVRPATFNLMLKGKVAAMSDAELDDIAARHPKKDVAEDWKRAARAPVDEAALAASRAKLDAALDRLEAGLADTGWLAGGAYSLAEVAMAPIIDRMEHLALAGLWHDRPAIGDWIDRIKRRPAFARAIPGDEMRLPGVPEAT
jgi:glutathione S-transferase